MIGVVIQAGAVLKQAAELLKNPAVNGAVKSFTGWVGNLLGKNSAKEKLKLVEENKHTEDTITSLQSNLDFMLEDNEELQKKLADKIKELEVVMDKEGIQSVTITTTNTIGDNSNENITIQGQTDFNTGGGDIIIGGNK